MLPTQSCLSLWLGRCEQCRLPPRVLEGYITAADEVMGERNEKGIREDGGNSLPVLICETRLEMQEPRSCH